MARGKRSGILIAIRRDRDAKAPVAPKPRGLLIWVKRIFETPRGGATSTAHRS
ncbi:MAG: hypothetical protein R3D44_15090 [Hyphomicrobiaceae bacterium]